MKIARHLQKIGYIICALFLFGGIFSVPISQGATYYVAPDGNDSNPGAATRPFKTIGRGAGLLKPGDTLYVRAGTYRESFGDSIPSGTSWDVPVTIAAFSDETVTIRPDPGAGRIFLFQGADTHHIVVDGFIMDAINISYDAVKISYERDPDTDVAHSIRITNSEIKNAPYSGLVIAGGGNEFINLKVHDNGRDDFDHGLYISSSDNLIDGCEIYNNSGWGVHVYNESNDKGKVNNNVISNNKIYRNGKSGRGSGVILSSGTGNEAYNNEIWENVGGIQIDYGAINTEVHNSIIYRNNEFGIYVGTGSLNAVIKNNDIYNNGGPAIVNYGVGTQLLR
jgi:hypothetical protein